MLARVLLLIDRPSLRDSLLRLAEDVGFVAADVAQNGVPIWGALDTPDCDIAIISRSLVPDPIRESIERIRALPQQPEVIVLTDQDDAKERAQLLGAGSAAVVPTDVPDAILAQALQAIIERWQETAASLLEAEAPERQFRLGDFVSQSPRMERFMEIAQRVAAVDSSVLILGETGVGKERLARAIHAEGPRTGCPFVVINCGAVPESLLESELFGHERGAFTGAERAHRGHFEMAHTGTILLDEIGEMPIHLQVKLLRVLQEREIQRLGSERPVPVDVRVMAATNRDLLEESKQKRFRSDLYYRLSVVNLTIPPLRRRTEDIPLLAKNYLKLFRSQIPTTAEAISKQAMTAMTQYDWPGNVRELINVVERAVLLTQNPAIALEDLPDEITAGWTVMAEPTLVDSAAKPLDSLDDNLFALPLSDAKRACLAAFERTYLERLLVETDGRIGETATRAGIVPRSLHTKMKQFGLRKEDFRQRRSEQD